MRKSAGMLRSGMIVVLDGKQRTIESIKPSESVSLGSVLVISCSDGSTFSRTPGAKVEVTGRVRRSRGGGV